MDASEKQAGIPPGGSSILLKEVELHQLELRYAKTRILTRESICSLAASLHRFGQITPLVSVSSGPLILIDGYRRVAALKHNGKDTALSEVWPCTEEEALLRLLVRSRDRKWEAFEEAGLLREILKGSDLSQARLAALLGKDPSWVARRLQLLDLLHEDWIELIRSGRISSWAASRVLVPLARANAEHALSLAQWIAREGTSTRDLEAWLKHYQKSNKSIRENLIREPSLFLKAARSKKEQGEAKALRQGPEGRWLLDLETVLKILNRLQKDLGALSGTDPGRCRQTLHHIQAVLSSLDEHIERSHHDQPGHPGSHPDASRQRDLDPGDQHDPQDLEKYRQGRPEGESAPSLHAP